jgi:hypothetical protein
MPLTLQSTRQVSATNIRGEGEHDLNHKNATQDLRKFFCRRQAGQPDERYDSCLQEFLSRAFLRP